MTLDTSTLTIATAKISADISDVLTSLQLDATADSVAQLTIEAADNQGTIGRSPLMTTGTTVTWMTETWQVAAITTTWGEDATVAHSFDCRSRLARALRRTYKASAEKKVSPSEWVTRRVTAAGGIAICQPSSKQATIAQSSGKDKQSELDVIANLASDQEWSWCEWGGRLWFGSRYWAWQGHATGQRLWPVTRRVDTASDALSLEVTEDSDTTDNILTGTLTLPYDYARRIRPWDRIELAGHGKRNGTYLVDGVSINADGSTPISLTLSVPHVPTKKAGSSK